MNMRKIVPDSYIEYFRNLSLILDETNLKIIDYLKRIGPRNMSEIARYIGEDPKKVNYRFNAMKTRVGLIIRALPSYSSMGLTNAMVFLPLDHKRVEAVKNSLITAKVPKKIYRVYGNISGIIAQLIVPDEKIPYLRSSISSILLKKEVKFMKILYLTDFFFPMPDLSKLNLTYRIWDYMPSELKKDFMRGERMKLMEEKTRVYIDNIDIHILSKLVEDATIPLLKIAEEIGTSPANLKYHFDNHIIKQGIIRDYHVYLPRYSPDLAGLFFFEFTFSKEEYIERFLYALSRSVYSRAFAKELGKPRVIALMEILWGDLQDVLQILYELCILGYIIDYKFSYIDLGNIYVDNLTPDMFDEKTGWKVPEDLGLSPESLSKDKRVVIAKKYIIK
jgi:DNA-binding Lrp family transcriptional regulator